MSEAFSCCLSIAESAKEGQSLQGRGVVNPRVTAFGRHIVQRILMAECVDLGSLTTEEVIKTEFVFSRGPSLEDM